MEGKYIDFLKKVEQEEGTREEFLPLWKEFKEELNKGTVRVIKKKEDGNWKVNVWVKKFILLGFKYGEIIKFEEGFIDKDTMGERKIHVSEGVRTVSPTTSMRDGIYLGKGVTFMPPCYANIGAYIDDGSMVDSCAIVGSCAQIGKNVHVGAGVVIGGVLEPVGAFPVIIEDDVFIGAGATVTEGTVVKKGAIIATGVNITGSTPVYDTVNGTIIKPNETGQIVIPEGAVVVPGTRTIKSDFDVELAIETPIIKKYGSKVELEELLRP